MKRRGLTGGMRWLIGTGIAMMAVTVLIQQDTPLLIWENSIEPHPPTMPVRGVETFCDDFRTIGDLSPWATIYPWGARHLGEGEQEEYVSPGNRLGLNPFSVRPDGGLTITASRSPPSLRPDLDGQPFISGLLTSVPSFSQRYGYFEMRARFPAGKGLWPAFWLAPTDMSWPPEIDIVEMHGDRPRGLYMTLHRRGRGGSDDASEFVVRVPDMSAAFHTYGMLWTPDYVAWYFDGRRVAFIHARIATRMYMLIDLAVGGDWVGEPTAATHFPAAMEVDYVRAFELPGQSRSTTSGRIRCTSGKGE